MLGLSVVALGLSFATAGCGLFDEEEAWQPVDGSGTGSSTGINGTSTLTGEGPSAWDDPSKLGKYGEFGTPDPNAPNFEPVYFAFNSASIDGGEKGKLETVVSYLRGKAGTGVVIEGNCDERGSAEYNMSLGEKRAIASKEFVMSQGIDESRMKTVSLGKENPANPGHDESAWAQNRRDNFVGVILRK